MLRSDFHTIYSMMLKLYSEDMTSGAGGVFGDAGSMEYGGQVPGGSDFYAPGDARDTFNYGTFTRKGKIKRRKKNHKSKSPPNPPLSS
jgi:hypothetical protein